MRSTLDRYRDSILCSLLAGLGGLLGPGCVDQPVCLPRPDGAPAQRLSELGLFVGPLARQQPAPGVTPYTVQAPLYSDGAHKQRFLRLPPGATLRYQPDRWDVPDGTLLVKTFSFPADARDPALGERRIETRLLRAEAGGLRAATYLWNPEQTDAECTGGQVDVPVQWLDEEGLLRRDSFHVPGTSQCASCHDQRPLGLRTRQLNVAAAFSDGTQDQIEHLVRAGVLDAAPQPREGMPSPQGTAPLAERARSYLDANCGHCHSPEGRAASTGLFWDRAHTAPGELALCRPADEVGGASRVLVPGRPDESVFLVRMTSPDPFLRMPRGPTHRPDPLGVTLLTQWVAAMPPAGCP